MKTSRISEIYKDHAAFDGANVTLEGWVRTVRDSKAFAFIEINDGSTVKSAQLVLDENTAGFDTARKLNVASAIRANGQVLLTPDAKQPFEIRASEVVLLGASSPDYPLQKKRHSFEYLRTIAHLRPRSNTFNAVFRVRSEAAFAIHDFFNRRGFVYAHTPIITGSDAEGAGEMFRVTTLPPVAPLTENGDCDYSKDFFGRETNLTVTGQMQAETFALAFKNTYTFGPTFRAEHSNTARHAAEFWMIEPEMAFCDLQGDMDIAEAMVKHIIAHVLETCPNEMDFFERFIDSEVKNRLTSVLQSDFARLSYTDAISQLEKVKERFEFPVYWGCDLQTEHERYLTEEFMKGRPVFITDYPKDIKAFYMRLNDDGKTVAATDLMVPGIGELIGGSQREERYDMLKARIEELGMDMDNYWWYLELRKYGGVTCAGFGIGFERLIMYLTGMTNIRDVVPYPRTLGTAEF